MYYHLMLTKECNLSCAYCGGFPDDSPDMEVSYTLDELQAFIEQDPDAVIAFYGGEPLLRHELLQQVMDSIPAKRFLLQTNATRLHLLGGGYLQRLHTLLVSVDGRPDITDGYRGEGTFELAVRNARDAKARGFAGDLVARMAVSEESDIWEEVTYLLGMGLFDNVHWQLDMFWSEMDAWDDLQGWLANSYNPGITRLIDHWLGAMVEDGRVLGIVPFKAVLGTMLRGETSPLRCGSGLDTFAISPSGDVLTCPICPEFDFARVGHIRTSSPDDVRDSLRVGEPCTSCDIFGDCGGRCLFANKSMLWGEEGFEMVCGTVRHLVAELRRILPDVQKLIAEGQVDASDFDYPEGNNACEIIP